MFAAIQVLSNLYYVTTADNRTAEPAGESSEQHKASGDGHGNVGDV